MHAFTGKNRLLVCLALAIALCGYSWSVTSRATAGDNVPACTDCHDDKQGGQYVHYPVAEGNCEACHTPAPEHLAQGGPGNMQTDRSTAACYQCHDPVPAEAGKGSEHSIVKDEKGCRNCHDPHAAEQYALLTSNPTSLCLGCHDREITMQKGGKIRKVANIRQKVMEMQYVHQPAIWCTACHDAHGSNYRSLLAAAFPVENYNTYEPGAGKVRNTFELCFGCHNPAMLNETVSANDTGFRHDTVRDGLVVRENLHWFHVVDAAGPEDKDRGRSCNICHDPHGSPQPHNIRASWPMEKHNLLMVFENRSNGGACMKSCHGPKSYLRLD